MSDCVDDIAVGGQLVVGAGVPVALGVGPTKIRGSSFVRRSRKRSVLSWKSSE